MRAFVKLAGAVFLDAPYLTLLPLAVDAVVELIDFLRGPSPESLFQKKLLTEPLQTGLELLKKARASQQKRNRDYFVREAMQSFVRAKQFESTEGSIQACFHGGVCADLLGEPNIAMDEFEASYSRCMDVETTIWAAHIVPKPGEEMPWKRFEDVYCTQSRRALLVRILTEVTNLPRMTVTRQFHCGNMPSPSGSPGAPSTPVYCYEPDLVGPAFVAERNSRLDSIYEMMRPIADILSKRHSRFLGLVPSRMLEKNNLKNGSVAARRRTDHSCRGELDYWR